MRISRMKGVKEASIYNEGAIRMNDGPELRLGTPLRGLLWERNLTPGALMGSVILRRSGGARDMMWCRMHIRGGRGFRRHPSSDIYERLLWSL